MPRFVLLKVVDDVVLVATPAPVPGPVTKADVTPEFIGVDADGKFSFAIPAYPPGPHNTLMAIHVSLFEKPADGSVAAIPADPAEIVKAPLHYSADTSTVITGQTVIVDATAAPEGKYSAALVAEFDQ